MIDNVSNRVKLVSRLGTTVFVIRKVSLGPANVDGTKHCYTVVKGKLATVNISRSHNITLTDTPSRYVYASCSEVQICCKNNVWIIANIGDVYFTAEAAGKEVADANEDIML